jgi:hypothetical protein
VAHEPVLACAPLKVRRRVYERGAEAEMRAPHPKDPPGAGGLQPGNW